jgi:protein required for attachment to host cells
MKVVGVLFAAVLMLFCGTAPAAEAENADNSNTHKPAESRLEQAKEKTTAVAKETTEFVKSETKELKRNLSKANRPRIKTTVKIKKPSRRKHPAKARHDQPTK